MTDVGRMSVQELLGKVLADEHADVLRQAVVWLAEELMEALGLAGVSKDQVSRLCGGLDEQVTAFRERPLEVADPYLWLDAKVEKVRAGGRVEHRALVIPTGWMPAVNARSSAWMWGRPRPKRSGGSSSAAWSAAAFAPWQRCTVHFLRDALGHCPKDLQQLVGAAIRPIFRANNLEEARRLLADTVTHLEARVPKVARLLLEAEVDLLAFYGFPSVHRSKFSTVAH